MVAVIFVAQRLALASLVVSIACAVLTARTVVALEPIPDRLVVLTFDDSVKSHFTVAAPPARARLSGDRPARPGPLCRSGADPL
jgi:hypothetical protein